MANPCLQMSGFLLSCLGWLGIIIATATNDWVIMCKYGLNTCKKMDELGAKGPWAECVISTGLYHCVSLTQILDLPAYIQTTRALMITGSIFGLPAVGMLLMSMPCISLGNDPLSSKNKRTVVGGVLIIIVALCGLVSTVWFPIGAHQEQGLMSFGFSLYTGWVGTILCLLGGSILTCCSTESSYQDNNRFYFFFLLQFSHDPFGGRHSRSSSSLSPCPLTSLTSSPDCSTFAVPLICSSRILSQ